LADIFTIPRTGEIDELPRWWDNITYRYRPERPAAAGAAPPASLVGAGGTSYLQSCGGGMSREDMRSQGLLSQPSVRFRKTINTVNEEGEVLAVNAQQ
jgi:hypothetical protein